ncbi:hypothetical protein [Pseudomonas synxantha]|uniref:hypothetical protein n=1 Tax=Pseudomonas synxantha TaxID=47883 RepID=UPI0027918B63|nr:hypothetical protein [Pseudomonas synxantha]MDQ0981226.1 hypothetical protein [Pseudomonas synxantha]
MVAVEGSAADFFVHLRLGAFKAYTARCGPASPGAAISEEITLAKKYSLDSLFIANGYT